MYISLYRVERDLATYNEFYRQKLKSIGVRISATAWIRHVFSIILQRNNQLTHSTEQSTIDTNTGRITSREMSVHPVLPRFAFRREQHGIVHKFPAVRALASKRSIWLVRIVDRATSTVLGIRHYKATHASAQQCWRSLVSTTTKLGFVQIHFTACARNNKLLPTRQSRLRGSATQADRTM